MINRVASYDNFSSVVSDLSRTQVKIDGNQEALASSKRVETAGDDPVASIAIQNVKQKQSEIDTYLSNIVLANNRLSNDESVTANLEEMTNHYKKRTLQIMNGALSMEDRGAYAQELEHFADEVYTLSNSRDEAGNYIFSGGRVTEQAFVRDNDGIVTFNGDTNVKLAAISSTTTLKTGDSGRNVFFSKNPYGDFQPDYSLNDASVLALNRAESSLDSKLDYTITFSENALTGNIEYQLWEKNIFENQEIINQQAAARLEEMANSENGETVANVQQEALPAAVPLMTGIYQAGKEITYQPNPLDSEQKLTIDVEGYPIQDGDRMDLNYQPEINIFDVMRTGIEEARSAENGATRTAQMSTVIKQIDSSYVHFNSVRSDIGSRLQTLETQQGLLEDYNLELEKTKGSLEDLDYTAAVVDYTKNTTALQAAQKAFSKTQQLSLFQYI